MGGGEWLEQKQEIRQEALNSAYKENAPIKTYTDRPSLQESISVKAQPDKFDQVYVFLRSIIPDWMLLTFILVGAMTVGTIVFKKQISFLLTFWANILKGEK